jgi:hypothetical protein
MHRAANKSGRVAAPGLCRVQAVLFACLFFLTSCQTALAEVQPASGLVRPTHTAAAPVLDLSSSYATFFAHNNPQNAVIQIGGVLNSQGVVSNGTALAITTMVPMTAAELIAFRQVLRTGQQSLLLSQVGAAVGGTADLNSAMMKNGLQSLTVPANVVVNVLNSGTSHPLNVSGNLLVNGSLFALQTGKPAAAVFNVGSLTVGAGGLISTSATDLNSGCVSSSSLVINSAGAVTNSGTIASSGPLNITASSISNLSSQTARAILSGTSVNLLPTSGALSNSGDIFATLGNLNIQAGPLADLTIANSAGRLIAPNGTVNLGWQGSDLKTNISVVGGEITAGQVNLYSGNGSVNVEADEVNAVVNADAGDAHIYATSGSLELGEMHLTGDPLFYSSGDLIIDSPLVFPGQNLFLLAGHNIVSAAGAGAIDTSSPGGGGLIIMIAGIRVVTASVPIGGPQVYTSSASTVGAVQILGPTSTGGSIDLNSVPITSLTSRGTAGNSSGGQVGLGASSGTDPASGHIILPASVPITTGGSGTGTNGSVTMIASALSGTAIQTGDIDARGGSSVVGVPSIDPAPSPTPFLTADSGRIYIQASHLIGPPPTPAPLATVVNNQVTQVGLLPARAYSPAQIVLGNIYTGGGPALISSGGGVTTGSIVVSNDRSIKVLAGLSNQGVAMARPGNVVVNGSLLADDITVAAGASSTVTFVSAANHDLAIRFGVTDPSQSSVMAPAGIIMQASGGMGVDFSGSPNFLGNLIVDDPGGTVTVAPNSSVSVEGTANLLATANVNNAAGFRAAGGLLVNFLEPALLPVATLAASRQSVLASLSPITAEVVEQVTSPISSTIVGVDTLVGWKQSSEDSDYIIAQATEPKHWRPHGDTAAGAEKRAAEPGEKLALPEPKVQPPQEGGAEPDVIKVMGNMGFMVYGWFTGNTKLEVDKGTTVTRLKDGTTITSFQDGSKLTERKDGSKITELRDGVTISRYADGTVSTDYKNGTVSSKYKDGTTVVTSRDGTTIATYPDGTTVSTYRFGSVVTTYKDGSRVSRMPDGTTITERENGEKITEYPDGKRVVEHREPAAEKDGHDLSRKPGNGIKGEKLQKGKPVSSLPHLPGALDAREMRGLGMLPFKEYFHSDSARQMIASASSKGDIDDLRTSKTIQLPVGHLIVSPHETTAVRMVEGDTHISPGSLAIMAELGADGAVLNLLDTRSGGVKIEVCGKVVSLPAGKELVMTKKLNAGFDDVNPFPEIPYRNVREYAATDTVKVFVCEFSIPEAIRTIEPIRQVLKSSRPMDRKLASKIIKTAAALQMVRRSATPFRVSPPSTSRGPAS